MKKLTKEQAAYIAGFLEGEGCFFISCPSRRASDGKLSLQPLIRTGQKDPDPLTYILKATGLGNISYCVRDSGFSSYTHVIYGRENIISFVKVIFPYLKSLRVKKRAWCVYRMAKLLGNRGYYITDANYEAKLKIYKIWETTRRGKRAQKVGKVK